MTYLRKNLYLAAVALAVNYSLPATAEERRVTEVNGVLVGTDGAPIRGVSILGCLDPLKKMPQCSNQFEVVTNSEGRFQFRQETGIAPVDLCTLCGCMGGTPPSCDPTWMVRFSFLHDGKSVEFGSGGIGFGLQRIELRCTTILNWRPNESAFEVVDSETLTPSSDFPHTRKLGISCRGVKFVE